MVLDGETLATGAPDICPECKKKVELSICHSAAGYYVGAWCDCGPYCRESGYYRNEVDARLALESGKFSR